MTKGQDKIFLAISPWKETVISVLDSWSLKPERHQILKEVQDVHSILYFESGLYVVSTGTDEVIRYEISANYGFVNPKTVWHASDTRMDTHHINSIVQKDGEIIVSAFGPKEGSSWKTAKNGYIFNLTTGEYLKKNIPHPHSLTVWQGKIFYCASRSGSFLSIEDQEPIFFVGGYARGVSWLFNNIVCIASSTRHKLPKVGWLMDKVPGIVKNKARSRIIVGNVRTKEIIKSMNLSFFAPEIYDLLVVTNSS